MVASTGGCTGKKSLGLQLMESMLFEPVVWICVKAGGLCRSYCIGYTNAQLRYFM